MNVRFIELTAEAKAYPSLFPDSPVAVFEVVGVRGATVEVLARDVSPFYDVKINHWPARARARALRGLCSEVTEAPLCPDDGSNDLPTLDLAGRFTRKDPKAPRLETIEEIDAQLLRLLVNHSRPADERAPEPEWLAKLDLALHPTRLFSKLEGSGLPDLRKLFGGASPKGSTSEIYDGLDRSQRSDCILLLAPYRERYLRALFPKSNLDERPWPEHLKEPLALNLELGSNLDPLEKQLAQDFAARGQRALVPPTLPVKRCRYRFTDRQVKNWDMSQQMEAGLWPGLQSVVDTLNRAQQAAAHPVPTSQPLQADSIADALCALDQWELRALGAHRLGCRWLATELIGCRDTLLERLARRPAALAEVSSVRDAYLAKSPRRRTSAWKLVPRPETAGARRAVDPLFAPPPLTEAQVMMVAYGTSDSLTEARVAEELPNDLLLKRLYDEKLEDADRMEIPRRFDLALESVDPIQIRPAKQEGMGFRYPTLPAKVLLHTFPDGGRLYVFRNAGSWVFILRGDRFSDDDGFDYKTAHVGWTADGEKAAVARRGELVLNYMGEKIVIDVDPLWKKLKTARPAAMKSRRRAAHAETSALH